MVMDMNEMCCGQPMRQVTSINQSKGNIPEFICIYQCDECKNIKAST